MSGAPAAFALSWLLFRYVLHPLLKRSADPGKREVDSILSTFGLLFLLQGVALVNWTSDPKAYSYLGDRIEAFGVGIQGNRLLVIVAAFILSAAVFAFLRYTTAGRAMRAIAVSAHTAPLVGIDVARYSAMAFATGGALAAIAGILLSSFMGGGVDPTVGAPYTLYALIVIVMGGIGNVAGGFVAALILGMVQTWAQLRGQSALGTILTFAIFSIVLLWRPQGLFGVGARVAGLRRGLRIPKEAAAIAAFVALLAVPFIANTYWLLLAIYILTYVALATAWAFFSGPTRYVSLAASAFFGLGGYCVAVLATDYSYPVALLAAVAFSAVLSALVGLATLRLSGMYFVIFTFGLASLVSEVAKWWEYNVAKSSGWYLFLSITDTHIYYQLLVLCAAIVGLWLLRDRTRMGFALKTLGADETVARQVGIDTVALKIGTFVVSSVVMTVAGAILAPRSAHVTAEYVFNPEISFLTVIAALLGGATSAWGPMLGVVPLLLLKDYLSINYSSHFRVILGAILLAVVFFIPNGLIGLLRSGRAALETRRLADLLDALARRLRGEGRDPPPSPPRAPSSANGAAAGHASPPGPDPPERKASA